MTTISSTSRARWDARRRMAATTAASCTSSRLPRVASAGRARRRSSASSVGSIRRRSSIRSPVTASRSTSRSSTRSTARARSPARRAAPGAAQVGQPPLRETDHRRHAPERGQRRASAHRAHGGEQRRAHDDRERARGGEHEEVAHPDARTRPAGARRSWTGATRRGALPRRTAARPEPGRRPDALVAAPTSVGRSVIMRGCGTGCAE